MNACFHRRSGHVLPHKIQPLVQQVTILFSPPLLCIQPSQIRIVSPCQMTTPIVHVTDVRVMASTAIFTGVYHKDPFFFAGVQSFVRTLVTIFILVTTDDGCDVGTAFEAPVVQSTEHFLRIRELGFAVRECAIIILQMRRLCSIIELC